MLPPENIYPFAPDLPICRLLNGLWQVSGGHGRIDPAAAVAEMLGYHDAGFTTWDLADHYGPAEEFIGAFRRQLAALSGPQSAGQGGSYLEGFVWPRSGFCGWRSDGGQ